MVDKANHGYTLGFETCKLSILFNAHSYARRASSEPPCATNFPRDPFPAMSHHLLLKTPEYSQSKPLESVEFFVFFSTLFIELKTSFTMLLKNRH